MPISSHCNSAASREAPALLGLDCRTPEPPVISRIGRASGNGLMYPYRPGVSSALMGAAFCTISPTVELSLVWPSSRATAKFYHSYVIKDQL